ncbi:roundabout homolog 1 isoform X2 [Osmerus eperlanus]|uniref:roundabout homolog 1 isoform X2 n=1 Tax=Osmerus eperlanus TaxID=29151 RepID=UPI002E0E0DAD
MANIILRLVAFFGTLGNLAGSRLRAEEAPRIVHHPSDVVVQAGSPATLSCRAQGSPEPSIHWLRNGQPLEIDKLESQSQPIVLSEGSLFFLTVVPGRRGQSQEGVYACVARNSAGRVTSRNASLYIAALQEDFRVQPADLEVAVGEVAILGCSPPLGHPEPNVTWRKDGVAINSSDQHYTELNGKLIVTSAQKSDSGVFVCVASNTVAVRESRAARLSVLAQPVLVMGPEDVLVRAGESAHFYCEVRGDPTPAVEWSREQGPLPNGRYLVNPDQSLQIHYVTSQDAGRYTCTAVNDVGVVTASAQLLVEDAASSRQRELHKELSSLRVVLENVTEKTPGSNTTLLQWKLQTLLSQPHFLEGFEVLYRCLLPASSDWAALRVALPSYHAQVGPLKRGYQYEFKVRPYGSSLYGRESNSRHLRVPETAPSAPPQRVSLTMTPDRNDTVHLSWDPPPHDAHNGIIQGYQVWCVQAEQVLNWTVDGGQHSLDLPGLQGGLQYLVSLAALNGAGVGLSTEPYRLSIDSQPPGSAGAPAGGGGKGVLAVLGDPVFIGSAGALLWCVLMVTAICLYRRHRRPERLARRHGNAEGLFRLASEDLIIKHRMAAPDSPWISAAWRQAQRDERAPGSWPQSQEPPGFRKTTLPTVTRKAPGGQGGAVPIVPDSCGVYGTFYVDLMGGGLKTFHSPARCPRMPHCSLQQAGETLRISQAVAKTTLREEGQALPWKQALPSQPRMGVHKDSWEKNNKRELHAVKSAPMAPSRGLAVRNVSQAYKHRLGHKQSGVCEGDPSLSPRLLHYSASLQLVDLLPRPPPLPVDDTTDTHSLSSEEGSSRSTRLTVDLLSLQSTCAASGQAPSPSPSTGCPSYSMLSSHCPSSSYCPSPEQQEVLESSQEVTRYLELRPRVESESSDPPSSRPFSPTPTLGYIYGPLPSDHLGVAPDDPEARPMGLRRARLRSTPSSCGSEWEGSLWNGWGSVSEGNGASARASLISSSDGSVLNDASFARILAAAVSESTASFSDFSPPASPLSALFPPARGEAARGEAARGEAARGEAARGEAARGEVGECFGELDPMPVWDWSTAWVEDMEAQYRALYPPTSPSTPTSTCDTWGRLRSQRQGGGGRGARGRGGEGAGGVKPQR